MSHPQTTPPPGPESLLALTFPSDPQISPDGQQVAYVLTVIAEEEPHQPDPDVARPRYRSHLWLAGQGAARQLTHAQTGRGDSHPRWSPDGQTLAFTRSVGTTNSALMLLPLAGGEARQISHFKQGVGSLNWSPDGRYLAFLTGGDTEDKRDERGEARVLTAPIYRFNGADWLPEQPEQLWLYDAQQGDLKLWYAPPELGIGGLTWKPDSSGVLYISSVDRKAEYQWRDEVFGLNLNETAPTQLTRWNAGIGDVVAHPGGQRLLLVGRREGQGNTQHNHLYLWQPDGRFERLDRNHDFAPGNIVGGDCHVGELPDKPVWLGADTLLFSSTVRGSCGLFTANLGGQVTPHDHDPAGVISAFTANASGTALIRESATRFPEVELNGVRVTDLNARLPFTPLAPQRVTFTNELGEGEGWALLPEGSASVPAVLSIHGGPHTDYGHAFTHEFQLLAANGYGVCYSNPRGSVGYGQAWIDAIYGRWGTVDADDLLSFFDRCLEDVPRLNRSKTAVIGGSYGGFMTNWITSHTTRFQAAITDRCISNLISFGGTSDIGLQFWVDELGLNFARRADAAKLWDLSPLQYVENVKTPTLIVHSVLDHRCPIEQAEQWYAALHLHDVPVRFVRFPGENHELSRSGRPDRRLTRLHEYLNWLGRWLSADADRALV